MAEAGVLLIMAQPPPQMPHCDNLPMFSADLPHLLTKNSVLGPVMAEPRHSSGHNSQRMFTDMCIESVNGCMREFMMLSKRNLQYRDLKQLEDRSSGFQSCLHQPWKKE